MKTIRLTEDEIGLLVMMLSQEYDRNELRNLAAGETYKMTTFNHGAISIKKTKTFKAYIQGWWKIIYAKI